MSEFSKDSAFKQAAQVASQLKEVESQLTVDQMIERAERISKAMEIDLNSLYDSLNVAIEMIDDPTARRAVEDIRDEVYRCMR